MIYTLGHSTLTPAEFLVLAAPLKSILDVRSFPGSRRYPYFAREEMQRWLPPAGLVYEWRPALGGRRKKPAGLQFALDAGEQAGGVGWQIQAFANYALIMATDAWLEAAEQVVSWAAEGGAVALMCAEAVWWRCHRSLISDYLVWRGVEVTHLPQGTRHSEVSGERLARYHPDILAAWRAWREEHT